MFTALWQRSLTFLTVALAIGCGDGPPTEPTAGNPATAVNLSGALGEDTVEARVGVTARIEDAAGTPVPGELIYWAVVDGDGSVMPETSTSDASGRVATTWLLGTEAGSEQLHLWWEDPVSGDSVPLATFPITVLPGAPVAFLSVPDTTLVVGESASLALSASDRFDNVVEAAALDAQWTSPDPTVATVDSVGTVTATGPGRVLVSASVVTIGSPAKMEVAVLPPGFDVWDLDGSVAVLDYGGGDVFLAGHGGDLVRASMTGLDTVLTLASGYVDRVVDAGNGTAWLSIDGVPVGDNSREVAVYRSADGGDTWSQQPHPDSTMEPANNSRYLGGAPDGRPVLKTQGTVRYSVDMYRLSASTWSGLGFPETINDSVYQILDQLTAGGDTVFASGLVQLQPSDGTARSLILRYDGVSWSDVVFPLASSSVYSLARTANGVFASAVTVGGGTPGQRGIWHVSSSGVSEVAFPYSQDELDRLSAVGEILCTAASVFTGCSRDGGTTWHRFDAPVGYRVSAATPDDDGSVWMAVYGDTPRLYRWTLP